MVMQMLDGVASYVKQMAEDNNVTAWRDEASSMAVVITRLSDDVVELDNVEQLLVNLKREGILSKAEALELQGRYFHEQGAVGKKLSV